eukprot:4913778-Prymnesium_polylepis.1
MRGRARIAAQTSCGALSRRPVSGQLQAWPSMASEKLRCSRGRFGGVGGGDAATTGAGGGDGERSAQQMGHCARSAARPAHDEQVLQMFQSIIP